MEFFCIISAWHVFCIYISFVKLCYGLRFLSHNQLKQLRNTFGGICQALLLLFLIFKDYIVLSKFYPYARNFPAQFFALYMNHDMMIFV